MEGWREEEEEEELTEEDGKIHSHFPAVICCSSFEEVAVSTDPAVPHDGLVTHDVRPALTHTHTHTHTLILIKSKQAPAEM